LAPPLFTLLIATGALAAMVLYLAVGSWRHRRLVASIPIRVHVNGTRGKSTVTRLIAAGFREAGLRTVAKSTGTAARLILPDGSERPLERCGPANICEQFEVIRFAAEQAAQVLVIECMAVIPDLQFASQHHIVDGTCCVITNVRADHQDVMGESIEEIAWSLGSVAKGGSTLVTAEDSPAALAVLAQRASREGANLVVCDNTTAPTAQEFGREEFPENLAVALKVCELHGIDRETALAGMRKANMDPGALWADQIDMSGTTVRFVNAFAANDWMSTERIIHQVMDSQSQLGLYFLANARRDRARRTADMARLLTNGFGTRGVFLVGDGADLLERLVTTQAPHVTTHNLAGLDTAEAIRRMAEAVVGNACLVGIGNIGGPAGPLCERLTQREAA